VYNTVIGSDATGISHTAYEIGTEVGGQEIINYTTRWTDTHPILTTAKGKKKYSDQLIDSVGVRIHEHLSNRTNRGWKLSNMPGMGSDGSEGFLYDKLFGDMDGDVSRGQM